MDGIILSSTNDAGGMPIACACFAERVGALSGDDAADAAQLETLAIGPQFPADDAVR